MVWYALTGVIVVAGVLGIAIARNAGTAGNTHPLATDHWHAALGVYLCDHWQGEGNWPWPTQTADGLPARAGTNLYAGLHSHGDGLIHIEPQTSDEMGKHATLGTYFKFGGWKLSSSEVSFVGESKKAGDTCSGKPGEVRWSVNGAEHTGDPASYKIKDGDEILVAFVPSTTKLSSLGQIPSVTNLESIQGTGTTAPTTVAPQATTATTKAPTGTTKAP
jgi:hypothetical protein